VNFVKLYIGDYLRDTGTLTLAQHGAYTLMLFEFYATEKPLPVGRELHRLLRADSKAEREAIDFIAGRYWQETPAGLVNARAIKETEKASHQREVNREVGKFGGRPKRTQSVSESVSESDSELKPNRNPNHSHSQTPKKERPKTKAAARPSDVSESVYADFLSLRASHHAPVSQTALDGIRREAERAGVSLDRALAVCCERGWRGFKAEWLREEPRAKAQSTAETAWQRSQRERVEQMTGGLVSRKAPGAEIIELEASNVRALG